MGRQFQQLIESGRLLAARLDSMGSRPLHSIPRHERLTTGEISGWFKACYKIICEAFGENSAQMETWITLQKQIFRRTSRDSPRFRRQNGHWDEVGATIERIHESMGLLQELGIYHEAKQTPLPDQFLEVEPGVLHSLLPGLRGYKKEIEAQLAQYPYQENVFVMIKYRDINADLRKFTLDPKNKEKWSSYRMVIANDPDWNITGTIQNFMACLYCCKYGIAIFDEPEERQIFSPNVAYELGIMQYQNKPCLVLMSKQVPEQDIFFDLRFTLYKIYSNDLQAIELIEQWTAMLRSLQK